MLHPAAPTPVDPPWLHPPRLGRHGRAGGEAVDPAGGSGAPSICRVVRGGRACVCQGVAGRGECPVMAPVSPTLFRARRGHRGSERRTSQCSYPPPSLPHPLTPPPHDQASSSQPLSPPFSLAYPCLSPPPSALPPFPALPSSGQHTSPQPPFLDPSPPQGQETSSPTSFSHLPPGQLTSPQPPPLTHPPPPSFLAYPFPPSPSAPTSALPPSLTPPHLTTSTTLHCYTTATSLQPSLPHLPSPPPPATTTPRPPKYPAAVTPSPPPRTTPDGNQGSEWSGKGQSRKVTEKGVCSGTRGRETAPYTITTTTTATATTATTFTTTTTTGLTQWFAKVVVVLLGLVSSAAASYKLKPTTTMTHFTLAGTPGQLPCQLPVPADRPTLILWYKDENTKPFYSFDARKGTSGHHKVHENSSLGRRSRFTLETLRQNFQTRVGFLEVKDVTLADAGNYTCRVDFMTSQTMMSLVQLHVHEEIRGLEIFDNDEKLIRDEVGPYTHSSHLRLSCRAYGGHPLPEVRWVSGGEELMQPRIMPLLDGPTQLGSDRPVSVRSAVLELLTLTREDDGRRLRCEARSTNLTLGLHREVAITMHLPPLRVEILDVDKPLRAGVKAAVRCHSTGSKPPAALTLTVEGSSRLETQPTQATPDQNMTIRRGELWPTSDDNGKKVVCTAANPMVPDYTLTAKKALDVHFPPEVQVRLAPALNPHNIKEGEDVYFECHIRANPPESRVQWLHQGHPLYTVKERGVLAQARNLVLQRVSRHAAGSYQCTATNAITTVTSAPASLDVMFAPECRQPSNVTVSVTATDEVTLDCAVESNPEEVSFTWKVNSSRGVKELPASTFTSQGRTSRLVYRPQEHAHAREQHGVVFCLGTNKIGKQKVPCMFIITPAGPPEEPVSCSLVNHSATSLAVACVPGHDGGLRQVFLTTVQDAATQEVVANITSLTPSFSVEGLAPGRDYLLLVTAANEKGRSSPYVIQGFALKVAENKINNSRNVESSSLLAVFVGVLSGFLFILTVLAVATRSQCRHRRRRRPRQNTRPENNKLGGRDEAPPSSSTKASLDEVEHSEDAGDEPSTPESSGGLLEPREVTPQSVGSPNNAYRTYVPTQTQQQQQQPLHPPGAATNHKYYKIKINCTRLNSESFV